MSPAGKQDRQAQRAVADHAAEPGRQRPGRAARRGGTQRRWRAAAPRIQKTSRIRSRSGGGGRRAAIPRSPPAARTRAPRRRTAASADRRRWRPESRARCAPARWWHGSGSGPAPTRSRAPAPQDREPDQPDPGELAQAAAQRLAQSSGEEAFESAVNRRHRLPLSRAPRPGDAAPRWCPGRAPWRRGCSPGRG